MQRAKFWSWRAATTAGRMVQLVIIAFVLFIGVLAAGEVMQKPLIADRVPQQHFIPAAHAK